MLSKLIISGILGCTLLLAGCKTNESGGNFTVSGNIKNAENNYPLNHDCLLVCTYTILSIIWVQNLAQAPAEPTVPAALCTRGTEAAAPPRTSTTTSATTTTMSTAWVIAGHVGQVIPSVVISNPDPHIFASVRLIQEGSPIPHNEGSAGFRSPSVGTFLKMSK